MRSLATCALAHLEGITSIQVYYRDAKVCNNPKEIAQEQCVCRACEVSKKDNGEVYKLRKTFAVFHLVLLKRD